MKRARLSLQLSFAGALVALVTVLLLASIALAQPGDSVPAQATISDLSWWTVDGGGHTFSTDSEYTLGGTVGQPDAGVLSDGDYTLAGGFWGGSGAVQYRIYLPLVLRNA